MRSIMGRLFVLHLTAFGCRRQISSQFTSTDVAKNDECYLANVSLCRLSF